MIRALLVAAVILFSLDDSAVAAEPAEGEFDGECVMGLALGREIKTDCSVSTVYGGKTYCFGNEEARAEFMKDPEGNLAKAESAYKEEKAG